MTPNSTAGSTQGSRRVASLVSASYWTGWMAMLPFLALHATALGATPATVGVILGGFHVVALLLSLPVGVATEEWGSGRMMLAGCLLGAAGSALIIFGGLWVLTAGLVIIGLAQIAVGIGSQVEAIAGATPQTVVRTMGLYFFYSNASLIAGPLLGALLARGSNYQAAFAGAVILSVLGAVSSIGAARRKVVREARVARPPALHTIVATLRDRPATRAALLVTMTGDMVMAFWNTFFPLLLAARGLGPGDIAFYFAARAVANTAVRPLIATASTRFSRTRAVMVGLVITGLALAVTPLGRSPVSIAAAVVTYGFASGVCFTLVAAAVVKGFSADAAGVAMGARMLMSRIGIILGPMLLGLLAQAFGFDVAFFAAAATIAGSALFYLLPTMRPSAMRAARAHVPQEASSDGP